MHHTAPILLSRDPIFNNYRDLLARRLRGADLVLALDFVDASMNELGGGSRRVEQRLRSTLAWCRDPSYPRLMLDSSPQEIAESWMYRDPAHSPCRSAAAHHKEHARRLQFIGHELRLPRHHRRGLVRAAEATAASAANLARKNLSNRENVRLRMIGAAYRVDYVKADQQRRRADLDRQTRGYTEGLIELQRAGWIVAFITIVLPEHMRPTLQRSHWWGLAGSPTADDGNEVLRAIRRAALPAKRVSERVGGFWLTQAHDSDQVHTHSHVAFRDQGELDEYLRRLHAAYDRHTCRLRSLSVVGAFGVRFPIEENAIDLQVLAAEDDIRRTVTYSMRELDRGVNLLPSGRRHAPFGALASAIQVRHNTLPQAQGTTTNHAIRLAVVSVLGGPVNPIPAAAQVMAEDNRIKHFPEEETPCLAHVQTSEPTPFAGGFSQIIPRVDRRYLRPPVRAPPPHCNCFQDRSIVARYTYSTHLIFEWRV